VIPEPEGSASFDMTFPEFPQRMFDAAEMSDGTLRFLALAGALLAYRLPPFIALNGPEASLHPDDGAPWLAWSPRPPTAPRSGSSHTPPASPTPLRRLAWALCAGS
jgi:hypothetical protein